MGEKLISAIIITRNEEEMLPRCLKSLDWADEVLVIDNNSIDRTAKIARKSGARVENFESKEDDFASWRDLGAKEALGKWLLYIDADERVTPELKKEIMRVLRDAEFPAFAIPRKNIILKVWMKHGWWPDYVLRLIRKDSLVKWEGKLHEQPKIRGEIGYLKSPLIHIKHDNFEDMIEKTNKWSEIEARLMFDAKHPPMTIPRFLSAIFREFWLRCFKQMAFLDGPKGVIYALYQVFSRFVSYAKLWEMQQVIKAPNSKPEIRNK